MNTEVMFSSKSVEWETPIEVFDYWDRIYKFNLDVCATEENAQCPDFYTKEQDGLKQDWKGNCWMNPPYGRGITGKWIEKAANEAWKGNCTVVALLPVRTDTKWFHQYIYNNPSTFTYFLKGRLKFGGCKDSAPFPSMIVVFNKNKNQNI